MLKHAGASCLLRLLRGFSGVINNSENVNHEISGPRRPRSSVAACRPMPVGPIFPNPRLDAPFRSLFFVVMGEGANTQAEHIIPGARRPKSSIQRFASSRHAGRTDFRPHPGLRPRSHKKFVSRAPWMAGHCTSAHEEAAHVRDLFDPDSTPIRHQLDTSSTLVRR